MAKKGKRPDVHLKCTECNRLNYLTNRSVINTPKKLELKKFCRHCRKHTLHKEARVVRAKK